MKKTIISVISPSGGTGVSTIAKELACIFAGTKIAGTGIRTCLVDAHVNYGSQRALFGIPSYTNDISTFARDFRSLGKTLSYDEIRNYFTWDRFQRYLQYLREFNLHVMPSSLRSNSPYTLGNAETDLLLNILLDFFDMVIVDVPNDYSPVFFRAIDNADIALLILNDNETNIDDIMTLRRSLADHNLAERTARTIKAVFNRCPVKASDQYLDPYSIKERTRYDVIEVIPEMHSLWTYNNRKIPAARANTIVREPLYDLAKKIVPEVEMRKLPKAKNK